MLGVNLGLDDERCRCIANRVAMEMYGRQASAGTVEALAESTPTSDPRATETDSDRAMTRADFMQFHKSIVKDPKGQQRFFHMCVFAAYDADGNGVLDPVCDARSNSAHATMACC